MRKHEQERSEINQPAISFVRIPIDVDEVADRHECVEGDPDRQREVHRRQDLDPGKPLVLEFVRSHCPAELARVEALFNRPAAFRNFKDLLRRQRLLDSWQVFEGQRIDALLRQWCQAQGLPL